MFCSIMERNHVSYEGTVTVELSKLVATPLSNEPQDGRIEKYSVSISNAIITRKELNLRFHVNCACTMPSLNL